MRLQLTALLLFLATGGTAGAQTQTPAEPQASGAADAGVEVTVSDENDWQDLGIAITDFATDAEVPTGTNAGSTTQLGRGISRVIASNLRNNGLFKPAGPDGLPQPLFGEVQSPVFEMWQGRSAEMLEIGRAHV